MSVAVLEIESQADVVRQLQGQLSRLPDAAPSDPGELICELATLANLVDAARVAAVHAADEAGAWQVDGARTPQAWVAAKTQCSGAAAHALVRAGRILESAPSVAEVFASGGTSLEHVNAIARHANVNDTRRQALPLAEAEIAATAKYVSADKLAKVMSRWAHHVDSCVVAGDEADAHDHAYLHIWRGTRGRYRVEGELDPQTAVVFRDAVEAIAAEQKRRNPDAEPVSKPQANAAALRELTNLALSAKKMPNGTDGLPVQLVVTMDLETLKQDLDQAGIDTGELHGHGPIPAATVRRLACDAALVPMVLNSESVPLDIGRARRKPTKSQRRAVTTRDQHCRWPGCTHTIQNCHHLIFWALGGNTDLKDMAGLCVGHHKKVHERNFLMIGNANKTINVYTPPDEHGNRRHIGSTDPPSRR